MQTVIKATSAGLALALLLLPLSSLAQQNDVDLAKQYYKLGEKLYQRADYRGARVQFDLAFQHSKRPALLFNIARCEEALGDHCKAVETYKKFLTTNPENKNLVQARVTNLTKLCAESKAKTGPALTPAPKPKPKAEPKAEPKPTPTPKTEPALTPAPKPKAEPKAEPKPTPTPETAPRPEPPPKPGSTLRMAGWTTAGIGLAAMVAGAVMGAMAAEKASIVEDGSLGAFSDVADDYDAGKALNIGAIAGLAVGGAALVGGAVLLYLGYTAEEKPASSAWLTPCPTEGGALVSGGFTF